MKAHFLIARDLYDANQVLDKPDYARLIAMLNFQLTQRKYLAIGGDIRLLGLFWKECGQIISLTQLTDKQFEKVESEIDAETPASKIKELARKTAS